MTLHSSLKLSSGMGAKRTVLKRSERIKWLMDKGLWKEKKVLGLPKIKILKIKGAKKAKKEEAKEGAPAAAAGAPAPAAAAAKPAPAAKPAADKAKK